MFDMKRRQFIALLAVANQHEYHHVCACRVQRSIKSAIMRAMPKVAREVRSPS
jgi:hypothetical protein